MTNVVRAELLKFRTTRARFAYPLALALLTGLATAATVGSADDARRGDVQFQADLVDPATIAVLLSLILGIVVVTADFRHGTITPTFLATPVREHVLAAKTLVAALLGALLAAFAVAVVAALAIPWLLALGHDLHLGEGDLVRNALEIVLAAAIWGALGAAVGAVVHSQVAAIVGALVWLLIAENIVIALLGLTDFHAVADYLPRPVIDSISGNDDAALGFWAALAVALAHVAAVGALGVARTRRRDVT